jgi:hypothetical protein
MATKNVSFNLEQNQVYDTYSNKEYDRAMIDSVLYLRSYNRISDKEWNQVLHELDQYKFKDMLIHKQSLKNIHIR